MPAFGGVACPAAREVSQCNTQQCPHDCELTQWTGWGACSEECGTGVKVRTREALHQESNGGIACSTHNLEENSACNLHPCPVDCVSEWLDWTPCSLTCGPGIQTRPVKVLTEAAHGGMACPLTQEQVCNTDECPPGVDCQMSEWTEDPSTTCATSLGIGTTFFERSVISEAQFQGKSCSMYPKYGMGDEVALLIENRKHEDVIDSSFQVGFTHAMADFFGLFSHSAQQALAAPAQLTIGNVGATFQEMVADPACSELDKVSGECTKISTDLVDFRTNVMVPQWANTRTCDTEFTPGAFKVKTRAYFAIETVNLVHISSAAVQTAVQTVLNPSGTTTIDVVPLHESFSPTSYPTAMPTANPTAAPTSLPTTSPTSYPTAAPSAYPTTSPSASPTTYPTANPSAFPTPYPTVDTRRLVEAETTAYPTSYPTLSPTSVPSYTPTLAPTTSPTESPTTYPTANPTAYPTSYPTQSPTSSPTGEPTPFPSPYPTQYPTAQPTAAPTQTPTLHPTTNPTPGFNEYTYFELVVTTSDMSSVCKLVEQAFSTDVFIQLTSVLGVPPEAAQTMKLSDYGLGELVSDDPILEGVKLRCVHDCTVSAWSEWGQCSEGCDGGVKRKTRTVTVPASGGGASCPELEAEEQCNTQSCEVNCNHEWNEWTECSATCSGGTRSRTWANMAPFSEDATRCPYREEETCNTHDCPIACEVSEWTGLSTCSRLCGGGVWNRTRTVTVPPLHNGEACPALIEIYDCNTAPCPVHCGFEYTPWSPCSASCGTGTQARSVVIHQESLHGGRACPGPEVLSERTCNVHACPTPAPTSPPTLLPTGAPTLQPTSAQYKPIVNVYGSDFTIFEATVNGSYTDEGAKCSDIEDGDLSSDVVISGAIYPQMARTGTYKLNYDCLNSFGEAASTATKTVIVRDGTCPVCTINTGPETVEASFPYIDAAAQCSDSLDGVLDDVVVSNPVDVERTGVYLVTYRARDAAGNWNDGPCKHSQTYIRTVRVVDTLKPVLALHYNGMKLEHAADGSATGRRLLEEAPRHKYTLTMGLMFGGSMFALVALFTMRSRSPSTPEFLDV